MRKYVLAVGLMLVTSMAAANENASNPLAAVNNVDLRWQYTSADVGDTHDVFVDGAYMVLPVLKLKYELHYKFTDVTGSNESDFERLAIKPIYFPFEKKLNEAWGLRAAVGFEWIVEFGHEDQGIGVGAPPPKSKLDIIWGRPGPYTPMASWGSVVTGLMMPGRASGCGLNIERSARTPAL